MALFRWLPASPGVWGGDVVESGGGAEGGGGGGGGWAALQFLPVVSAPLFS